MVNILKGLTRLRVKANEAPLSGDKVLGQGIDVVKMPEGHVACPMCDTPYFECWVGLDNHRIEIGCCKCGWDTRLLLPIETDLKEFLNGKFTCFKHPKGQMVIIKNIDMLCVGCRYCRTQIVLDLKTKSNLILAN